MNKILYVAIAAAMMSVATSCTQENNLSVESAEEYITVKHTVIANRADISTRVALNENMGTIKRAWEDEEYILVTNSDGYRLGVMEITDRVVGKFEGDIILSANFQSGTKLNYLYLGKELGDLSAIATDVTSKEYLFNSPNGTREDIANKDVLFGQAEVAVVENKATNKYEAVAIEAVTLKPQFSIARFELKMPEGVTLANEKVTVSGIYSKGTFNFSDGSITNKIIGDIEIDGKTDFYMPIVPTDASFDPVFTVSIGEKNYKGEYHRNNFPEGGYLRKTITNDENEQSWVGVPIEMQEVITLTYDDNGLKTTSFVSPTTETSVGGTFTIKDQALAVMDYESLQGYDAFKKIFDRHSNLYDKAIEYFKCIGWSENPNHIQDINWGKPITDSKLYVKGNNVTFTKNTTLYAVWTYGLTILEDFNFPESANVSGTNTNPKVGSRFYGQPYNIENPVNLSVKDYEMVGWSYEKMDPLEAGESIDESKLITTVTFQKPELYKTVYIVWRKKVPQDVVTNGNTEINQTNHVGY